MPELLQIVSLVASWVALSIAIAPLVGLVIERMGRPERSDQTP